MPRPTRNDNIHEIAAVALLLLLSQKVHSAMTYNFYDIMIEIPTLALLALNDKLLGLRSTAITL